MQEILLLEMTLLEVKAEVGRKGEATRPSSLPIFPVLAARTAMTKPGQLRRDSSRPICDASISYNGVWATP